jgi:hypothetical protein
VADYALFLGFGAVVRVRETHAVKVFGESMQLTTRAATIVDSVGVIAGFTGGRLAELMGSYEKDTADIR